MANDFINTERELRRITNNSQPVINVENNSPRDIPEGDLRFTHLGKNLILNKKHKGLLWKSNFSADGNQYVDKALIAEELKFTRKFTDYKFFSHGFGAPDIADTKYYVPWYETRTALTTMDSSSTSFLAPYKMILHKLYVRPETLSDTSAELAFGLDKQDDGDTTVDSVATFTYDTTLASDTLLTVNRLDWNNTPVIEAGDKVGISMQASKDPSGTIDWYITSVWEVEIIL